MLGFQQELTEAAQAKGAALRARRTDAGSSPDA
jgi:hypothetical protein